MTGLPPADPVLASLTTTHAHLAESKGRAYRYQVEVAGFTALAGPRDAEAWADLADLAGPGQEVSIADPPADWEILFSATGVQMVAVALETAPFPLARVLGPADVPAMLDLVARTEPGPLRPRTIEMGTYLGVFEDGALVAMAGERLRPPGWTEISAVCTDPAFRGRGLAGALVRAVAHGIVERGDRPFLHATATNTPAIRLYTAMGFELVARRNFSVARTPE
ncbi:MAG: GNAT family N-acetyltransferase [Umezawaea sp.]